MSFVRQSTRALFRRPGYSLSFVLPLALALGGACVILALVRGVLLEPLPFRDPERLVQIRERNVARGNDQTPVAVADFYDMKSLASFEGVAGFQPPWDMTLSGSGDARNVRGASGTYELFDTLGVAPLAGRLYTAADEGSGEEVVVLSDDFAVQMFGSVREAVGKTLVIQGTPSVVIGVLDSRQALPVAEIDVFVPMSHSETMKANRRSHVLQVVGRLAPGATLSTAQSELDLLMERIRRDHPEEKAGEEAFLKPLHGEVVGGVRRTLTVLMTAVGILLLIAIANVSGLAIARARSRSTELAVRRSLGASGLRASAPIVVETMLLAIIAGVIAAAGASVGLRAVTAAIADWVPRVSDITLQPVDLAACLGAAIAAGGIVALATTMIGLGARSADALRGAGRSGMTAARDRLRATAVVVQVAMSFVLLSGAAVLVRSMVEILTTDPGYRTDVLTAEIELPSGRYESIEAQNAFFRELVERASSIPGVASAAAASSGPVTGARITRSFLLESEETVVDGLRRDYPYLAVTPGYFGTMAIPVLRGRAFADTDAADSPGVIIVNEAFVRRESPGRDVLGRRLTFSRGTEGPWLEIVGVVADTRYGGLDEEVEPQFFVPNTQRTWTWLDWMTLVVRAEGDPADVVGSVRRVVRDLEPAIPVDEVVTVEQHIVDALGKRRFQLFLIGTFAALALVLTVVGIYALISNALAMRMREVGVRLALGAAPRDVTRLFAREGLALVAGGIAIGLVVSAGAMRFLETMVVRVSPNDPLSVSAAVLLILTVAGLSSWMPARRAARVDPAVVLRSD